jgi:hypothetical protein
MRGTKDSPKTYGRIVIKRNPGRAPRHGRVRVCRSAAPEEAPCPAIAALFGDDLHQRLRPVVAARGVPPLQVRRGAMWCGRGRVGAVCGRLTSFDEGMPGDSSGNGYPRGSVGSAVPHLASLRLTRQRRINIKILRSGRVERIQ